MLREIPVSSTGKTRKSSTGNTKKQHGGEQENSLLPPFVSHGYFILTCFLLIFRTHVFPVDISHSRVSRGR